MNKTISTLFALCGLALGLAATPVQAVTEYLPGVVTFDDLANSPTGINVPAGYAGFNWGSGMYSLTPPGSQNDYVAFTTAGATIFRADRQPFYFDGADFFLRPGADTNDFAFVLYGVDGTSVYNGLTEKFGRNQLPLGSPLTTFQPITEGPDGKAAGPYTGLVRGVAIAWDNRSQGDLGMDNFRFRAAQSVAPAVSPVPEPDPFAMMLAGLALMGVIARRRQGADA